MNEELRVELSDALRNNSGQLGKVFALLEEGKESNRELVEGGAAANQGAAANLRVVVRAVLDDGPTSRHPDLVPIRDHLDALRIRHHEFSRELLQVNGGELHAIDLFMTSALLSSYHVVDAFLDAWDAWNIFAAVPLFRVELDVFSRVAFMARSERSQEVVNHLLSGKSLTEFPGPTGKPIGQQRIRKLAYKHHPWLEKAYDDGSAWSHFSHLHFLATWRPTGEDTIAMSFPLRPGDVPPKLLSSVAYTMSIAVTELLMYVETWRNEKEELGREQPS